MLLQLIHSRNDTQGIIKAMHVGLVPNSQSKWTQDLDGHNLCGQQNASRHEPALLGTFEYTKK